jgi:hypothetical protein
MRVSPAWIAFFLLLTLIACSTPTPSPTIVPIAPQPTSTLPPTPAASATPLLVINLITPTPLPTNPPPPPTESATATINAPGVATTSSTPRPPELGHTSADGALVAVLQNCWHVSDPRQLNGQNAAHVAAYDCARGPLANIAQNYPSYGMVHRLIAWGYYYKDNAVSMAAQEYSTAATLYHQEGDRVGESEARMRLGLLLVATSRSQACAELAQAGSLDPTNDRATTYYEAYACRTTGNQTSGGKPVSPPVLQANLDQVRGKIIFKSDRDGGESYYAMDPDGRNQKRVSGSLFSAAMRWEPFSPDHSQVAVVRSAGFTRKFGYNNDIWITDPSGGGGRALANPANDYDPVWSPAGLFDGSLWIAFVSNRGDIAHAENQGEEVWIMHNDGTNSRRLTCHGPNFSKHPSWSPDARHLVFYSNYPDGGNKQIYVIDMTGLGTVSDPCQVGDALQNLSNDKFNDYDPVWVK